MNYRAPVENSPFLKFNTFVTKLLSLPQANAEAEKG